MGLENRESQNGQIFGCGQTTQIYRYNCIYIALYQTYILQSLCHHLLTFSDDGVGNWKGCVCLFDKGTLDTPPPSLTPYLFDMHVFKNDYMYWHKIEHVEIYRYSCVYQIEYRRPETYYKSIANSKNTKNIFQVSTLSK